MAARPPAFVLASGSPRRRELLSSAGIRFEIVTPDVKENAGSMFTVREATTLNATRKALAIARARPEAVVLAADTLVALEGDVIGKPADIDAAHATLRRLSGREHQVCTGVFICARAGERASSFHVFTDVQFRELTAEDISTYLAKIEPLDKAGAYAAQGEGGDIIKQIRGSYTNVVGLPMEETLRALRAFGIEPATT